MKPQASAPKGSWERLGQSLRIPVMIVFVAGCFGVLLFLWIAFGGSTPLKAKKYELKVSFPEASTLAVQADVRIAGVNVGKVRRKDLDKTDNGTQALLSIDKQYAPIPKDSKAILRQKT